MESEVRGYVRVFPAIFDTARCAHLYDEHGNSYIDFFAGTGTGTLNYGHNNPIISEAMIEYLQRDGIVHALDKATVLDMKCTMKRVSIRLILSRSNMMRPARYKGLLNKHRKINNDHY